MSLLSGVSRSRCRYCHRAEDQLACSCGEGVKIVALETGEVLAAVSGDTEEVTSIAWHPSGQQLAISTKSLLTRFWAMPDPDADPDLMMASSDPDPDEEGSYTGPRCVELHSFRAHDMPVATMDFDSSGALRQHPSIPTATQSPGPVLTARVLNAVATADSMGNVRVWDAARKYCTHNFHAHRGVVHSVRFHPDKSKYQVRGSVSDSWVRPPRWQSWLHHESLSLSV